jgi:putative hydrolase of the HAD superfamily
MSKKYIHKYRVLFFDLDRTLWDYRSNSEQTLSELVDRYVPELTDQFKDFLNVFYEINDALWLEYRNGVITKGVLSTKRFIDVFKRFGIDAEPFVQAFSADYKKEGPSKTNLFPTTIETLEYLKNKAYRMYLLTNGFVEVQRIKVRESKLEPFFEKMITSEEVGFQKPDHKIFEGALKIANANLHECLMIGDDLESDIAGAISFGMDSVFFNPAQINHTSKPTFEIHSLDELKKIL